MRIRKHNGDPGAKFAILKRRDRVQQLYSSGHTMEEIAAEVGVCRSTVGKDIAHIKQLWLERIPARLDEYIAEELAKIRQIDRECWKAWFAMVDAAFEKITDEDGTERYRYRTQTLADGRVVPVAPPPPATYLSQLDKTISRKQDIFGLGSRESVERLREVVSKAEIKEYQPVGVYLPALDPLDEKNEDA